MNIRVQPYRFTDNPAAMVAFLQVLGLAPRISSADGGFAILEGAAGSVAVHRGAGAAVGKTHLALEVAHLEELSPVAGVVVWDESYGRQAGLTGPFGDGIWINEPQQDLHGYRAHDAVAEGDLTVTMVRYSPDFDADVAFFAALGFAPATAGDQWWLPLQAGTNSGMIGLHRPSGQPVVEPATENPVGDTPLCQLGFETAEPLQQVAARLVRAGHAAQVRSADGFDVLHVVDPDGQSMEIHPKA